MGKMHYRNHYLNIINNKNIKIVKNIHKNHLSYINNDRFISFFSTMIPKKENLIIFDTTLRDGEQSPGATLNFSEKLDIARSLSILGVDVCEAGFPISSPGDFDSVSAIAQEIGPLMVNREKIKKPMIICGLARSLEKDIKRCYDAVKHAPYHRIHTFLATSDIHLKYKLKISRKECIKRAVMAVEYAKTLCDDVEFSPEDAGRSDPIFLCEVLDAVINAGATTLNIPDTVGYTVPEEYGNLISYLFQNTSVKNNKNVVFSTHCHNDLGLAAANTLSGIKGGARQVEVTMNGIGERAGNTALEEIIMTLKTRAQKFPVYTNIDSTQIIRCSRMVSHYTGMLVQPNKAIVGANAFAHESGIHQDGILKHQSTYEIMLPEAVGLTETKMVLGKHSGKHAYKKRLMELGYDVTNDDLELYFHKLKILADEKKVITDKDIEAIVCTEMYKPETTFYELLNLHITAGNLVKPTATVTLLDVKNGTEISEASMGTGPVDALFHAIKKATNFYPILNEYTVKSITNGSEALGEVTVRIQEDSNNMMINDSQLLSSETIETEEERTVNPQTEEIRSRQYIGHGANTDILVASATAYINALNRFLNIK